MTRRKLPPERKSITKTMRIRGAEPLYVTAGFFDDGALGELFVFAQMGDEVNAVMDALATAISIGLQHGVPPEEFYSKLIGVRSSPAGMTGDGRTPIVASRLDYLGRWMRQLCGGVEETDK